ncbi:MAG: exonuclease subunit SbcD [Nitriliruptorales bacterium]|nr:exonuclease subunit SbcD [Nitriliruptorales bacterium]
MRILHTADWHVGRSIRGRSRAGEHEAVLAELVGLAEQERAELILMAGDVFDSATPSPEAERIVYRTLLDLAGIAPVVMVAGNHDSPQRLAAVAPLLAASRVHVGAVLARPEDGGVIDITTAGGETARLAMLPFLSQRQIVRADDLMRLDADQHAGRYAARVQAVLQALSGRFSADTVNLIVTHLMVAGGTMGGGERAAHTIFDYCVPANALPANAHYAALGHLHRAQRVPAPCPAWYPGSPLQLDFGESQNQPGVLLVDAEPGRPAQVREHPLTSGRLLRTLRGTLGDLEALAGTTGSDHLRVVVVGDARAGLSEQVRDWFPEAADVTVEPLEGGSTDPATETPARLGRSPAELFAEYLAERGAADGRVAALFRDLLDEVNAPDAAS